METSSPSPYFPLGHLTPPCRVRVHPPSPLLIPHSKFGFVDSSTSSFDSVSSQPHFATMLGTIVGVENLGSNQGCKDGNPIIRTSTGMVTPTPFLFFFFYGWFEPP